MSERVGPHFFFFLLLILFLDTTFVNFNDICSGQKDFMFITNPINEDLQHPVQVSGIKMINSNEQNKVFVHRPDVGLVTVKSSIFKIVFKLKNMFLFDF